MQTTSLGHLLSTAQRLSGRVVSALVLLLGGFLALSVIIAYVGFLLSFGLAVSAICAAIETLARVRKLVSA